MELWLCDWIELVLPWNLEANFAFHQIFIHSQTLGFDIDIVFYRRACRKTIAFLQIGRLPSKIIRQSPFRIVIATHFGHTTNSGAVVSCGKGFDEENSVFRRWKRLKFLIFLVFFFKFSSNFWEDYHLHWKIFSKNSKTKKKQHKELQKRHWNR